MRPHSAEMGGIFAPAGSMTNLQILKLV